jgi:ADP-ribose pyrophosphatase YjhB (NUDIX family)
MIPFTSVRWSDALNYCTQCGSTVSRRWVAEDRCERFVCDSCRIVHYQNPRVLVVCVVVLGDKLLMCRRAHEPERGKWIAPSGFLEIGETLQEGAARETFEETGVIVRPDSMHLYSVVDIAGAEQVAVVLRTHLSAPPVIQPGPECSEVRFMSEDEIRQVELAWAGSTGDSTRWFFEQLRLNAFRIQLVNIAFRPGESFHARAYEIARSLDGA